MTQTRKVTAVVLLATLFLCEVSRAGNSPQGETGARRAARELAEQLRTSAVAGRVRVVLSPLKGADGDPYAAAFATALIESLRQEPGVVVVDPEAVQTAIEEAGLLQQDDATALTEVAGALGAAIVLMGTIELGPSGYVANLRGVDTKTGTVAATLVARFAAEQYASGDEAHTLHAQLRRLSDQVAAGLDGLEGELRYQRVAVLPFSEIGASTGDKQLGLLVSAELTTLLHRDHGIGLVERSQIKAVIDELALGQSGLTDPSKSVEVGKLTGAQALILGTVAEAGSRYLINTRVVSAKTAQVTHTAQVSLPASDLVALSSEAVVLRTRAGALYRSLLLPGWGQLYNRQAGKGALLAGCEAIALGAAGVFHALAKQADREYEDSKDATGDWEALHEPRESRRAWRNNLLLAALAVHALNVVDALINGRTFDDAQPFASGGAYGVSLSF